MRWLQLVYSGLLCANLIGHSFKARKKMPMETKTKDKEQAFQMSEAGIWPPGRSRGQQPGEPVPKPAEPSLPLQLLLPTELSCTLHTLNSFGGFFGVSLANYYTKGIKEEKGKK